MLGQHQIELYDLRELSVIEVVRHLTSGRTEPYQCRLDDGDLYAVKGRNATTPGLIAEAVAAKLGQDFGLPIPDFAYCYIPHDLLQNIDDNNVQRSLGTGMCFASKWVEPVENLTMPMISKVGHRQLAEIYVFDHWIENGDRSLTPMGENVNLLFSLPDQKLIAIDHNLAFSNTHIDDDLSVHAGRGSWKKMGGFSEFRNEIRYRMISLIPTVDATWDALPYQWTEEAPEMLERIKQGLQRMQAAEFWNELG